MQINSPLVLAEIKAEFARYESAVLKKDVAVLDELFWNNPLTLRYGVAENLYDYEAIEEFRASRSQEVDRICMNTIIGTWPWHPSSVGTQEFDHWSQDKGKYPSSTFTRRFIRSGEGAS